MILLFYVYFPSGPNRSVGIAKKQIENLNRRTIVSPVPHSSDAIGISGFRFPADVFFHHRRRLKGSANEKTVREPQTRLVVNRCFHVRRCIGDVVASARRFPAGPNGRRRVPWESVARKSPTPPPPEIVTRPRPPITSASAAKFRR